MPLYESTFIVRQDVSQADVNKLADGFAKIISDNGGEVIKTEHWGLMNLAYPIKKNKRGHYVMFGLNTSADAIKEMERRMKINEEILRCMTIRVEKISSEPSIMMNKDSASDEGEEVAEVEIEQSN